MSLAIAKNANVNFQTLKKLWNNLEKREIVIKTRILGGAELYRINTANAVVKKLIELNNFLCWKDTGKEKLINAEQII